MASLAPTHVSFRGEFPTDHSPAHPAGLELADFGQQALQRQSVRVVSRGQTDYSHTVVLAADGRRFDAMVGLVDVTATLGSLLNRSASWVDFGLKGRHSSR